MAMVKNIMDQIQISNYSLDKVDSPKAQDHTTAFPGNKKASPVFFADRRMDGIKTRLELKQDLNHQNTQVKDPFNGT